MDVMLESTTWAERYLSNPFPYIVDDVTKVKYNINIKDKKKWIGRNEKMFFWLLSKI